jgi:transcriptional regulator with XRE-family HTH domain
MPSGKKTVRQAGIVQAFAERLRGTRQARGMTQRDLADKSHVTVTYISRLEAGSSAPGIDTLDQLARALQVSVVDLLPMTPAERPEAQRERVRGLFETVVGRAGPETLTMLETFLARLAESKAAAR